MKNFLGTCAKSIVGTISGWDLILPRYTQPEKELQLLLHQLNLVFPYQLPHGLRSWKRSCSEAL